MQNSQDQNAGGLLIFYLLAVSNFRNAVLRSVTLAKLGTSKYTGASDLVYKVILSESHHLFEIMYSILFFILSKAFSWELGSREFGDFNQTL